jgi:hypothetical protein
MSVRRKDERGSMLPLLGGLIFVALVVLGVSVDVARLHGTYVEVGLLADVAAESGAAMIDELDAHDAHLRLDPERALAAVGAVIGDRARQIEAVVDGASLCVSIVHEHRMVALSLIGVSTVDVVVRSCATPMAG